VSVNVTFIRTALMDSPSIEKRLVHACSSHSAGRCALQITSLRTSVTVSVMNNRVKRATVSIKMHASVLLTSLNVISNVKGGGLLTLRTANANVTSRPGVRKATSSTERTHADAFKNQRNAIKNVKSTGV